MLKIIYDLLLYCSFCKLKPLEEQYRTAGGIHYVCSPVNRAAAIGGDGKYYNKNWKDTQLPRPKILGVCMVSLA
jgi:hypothetical protein